MPYKFSFDAKGDDPVHFHCTLTCRRCIAKNANGKRCTRTVCIGLPMCWQHMLRDKHLQIRQSTVPGAGNGVFAVDKSKALGDPVFKKDEKIVDYDGERMTPDELTVRFSDHTAPYTLDGDGWVVDAACVRGAGAMINHPPKGARSNVQFMLVKGHNRVFALRTIRNGEEIFVNYGKEYEFHDGSFSTKRASRPRLKTAVRKKKSASRKKR